MGSIITQRLPTLCARAIINSIRYQSTSTQSTRRNLTHASLNKGNETVAFPESVQVKHHQEHSLARLPLSSIVRSLVLGTFFTSPLLYRPGILVLGKVADSNSGLLNPDRNLLIRAIVKPLIYDHFCAGTNKAEIQRNVAKLKQIGFSGVILGYGKEYDPRKQKHGQNTKKMVEAEAEIEHWRKGNVETLQVLGEGDILAMKYTGAGKSVVQALLTGSKPPTQFNEALQEICRIAAAQGTRLFVDAEQDEFQATIDDWTVDLMRQYNRDGKALIYNTIQSYLKNSRSKLEHELSLAEKEGWTLGVKLVRGAYIGSDPRHKIHDTKAETDANYNGIVKDVLTGNILKHPTNRSSNIALFAAGHNPESVAKASDLVRTLSAQNALNTVPDFGQLQGMGDTLSCRLIQHAQRMRAGAKDSVSTPGVYKYSVWGSVQDCMQYLVRRAVENRGGTDRMKDGMNELWEELRRRMRNWAMGRRG
ncbi:FAD-linked oxidoreductase-like protein [Lophiotrema nucula]|uniref:Proline dehydrogenase n=1 Tax=Lophiotrema nucula TaxID=690887 RepID=A0A6A5YIV4_9PLEO|nr:FAD-linked oxidoreductase-like protein [Lophiotrema nucula]